MVQKITLWGDPTHSAKKVFGEVYICEFPFTSAARSKIRPVVVLFDLKEDSIICRVTSLNSEIPQSETLDPLLLAVTSP
jgi:hypothetical protein